MREKLAKYISEYLNTKVIFVIDLILSVAASTLVLLIANYFASSDSYGDTFAHCWIFSSFAATVVMMLVFKSYRIIVRHSTIKDILGYIIPLMGKELIVGLFIYAVCFFNLTVFLALVSDFMFSLFFLISVRIVMLVAYDVFRSRDVAMRGRQRILIFGTSEKSIAAVKRFQLSESFNVVGLLDKETGDRRLYEVPFFHFDSPGALSVLITRYSVNAVLFAREEDVRRERDGLVKYCLDNGIKVLIIPSVDELPADGKNLIKVREVKIEDLLGRDEIKISEDEIRDSFRGKVVMVTGAAGSIGSELCRQIANFGIERLILFDNAETPMHSLRLEIEEKFPYLNFVPVIGSVRHPARLDYAFRRWKPQIVFHVAAYKHVPLMEENPCEAVFANVFGSRNVADRCVEYGVEKMIMISTDKAVNPTNVMGCSKRLAEIYVQSLGVAIQRGTIKSNTRFVTTRFGNVLGSNGSVIPRFSEQIAAGGPVTVTHPDITRYFMTIPEACRLVMEAANLGKGNDIFVFDMGDPVKIDTLARKMISLAGLKVGRDIAIEYSGLRPGEKLYEELLANEENTIPTSHSRIRIAKVREYEYQDVVREMDELIELAKECNPYECVKKMKQIVPEFVSANSRFCEFDK